MMRDSVFHIRLNDFELQAERMLDASLRTCPIAIISSHHQNGTIVSLSSEAVEEGLNVGLKVSIARKMSHSVILLPYNSTLYSKVHQYVYKTIAAYSPVIEPATFGQFYADMTGMEGIYKSDLRAGSLIAGDIHSRLNLSSRIGISVNKLVSRISTAVIPETIFKVNYGNEPRFLSPLPSEVLPSANETSVSRILKFLFLHQVGNIQEVVAEPEVGEILLGKYYKKLALEANGRDNAVVQPPQLLDHIMEQTILAEDTNDEMILLAAVRNLAEQVAYQLRRRCQIAKSIMLEIHYTDGFKSSRRGVVKFNDDRTVEEELTRLFLMANYRRNRIRTILVDVTHFQPMANQLDLFQMKKDDNLSAALDHIRGKYGFSSIMTASGLLISSQNNQNSERKFCRG